MTKTKSIVYDRREKRLIEETDKTRDRKVMFGRYSRYVDPHVMTTHEWVCAVLLLQQEIDELKK